MPTLFNSHFWWYDNQVWFLKATHFSRLEIRYCGLFCQPPQHEWLWPWQPRGIRKLYFLFLPLEGHYHSSRIRTKTSWNSKSVNKSSITSILKEKLLWPSMIVIVHPSPSKLLLMLSRMVKLFLMLLRAKVLDYYSKLSHAFHIILHQMGQRKRIGFFPFHFPVLELFPTAFLILTQIQYAFEYNLTLSLEGDTKAAILCEINDSFVHKKSWLF